MIDFVGSVSVAIAPLTLWCKPIISCIDPADPLANATFAAVSSEVMSSHLHENHDHQHGEGCGHTAIRHGDHLDYLHDGHLHHQNADGSVEEHTLDVTAANPDGCTAPDHACAHEDGHHHGPGCGHEAVPHGDHVDYLVDGRLHHPHGDHCDDHGPVERAG